MPGGGDFVQFSRQFCTEKLSPGEGILTEKIVARGDGNRSN